MDFISGLLGFSSGSSSHRTSGDLTRDEFVKFASTSCSLFASEEFKTYVRSRIAAGKQADPIIAEKQKEIFEMGGVEGSFGLGQLRHIQSRFEGDQEVTAAFMALVNAEDMFLDEVELPPEQFAQKMEHAAIARAARRDIDDYMARLPQEQRMDFVKAVNAASIKAAAQIPKMENMTTEEFKRSSAEMAALTKTYLAEAGFVVGTSDDSAAAHVAGSVLPGSSAMSPEEQRKFFESRGN